jgi:hypothetical protein
MISSAVATVLAAVLAQPAIDMYLPPAETGGGEYLFNPASKSLRQAAVKPAPGAEDRLDAAALADDLLFLRRAMRKLYIGYSELLQVPDFDVEALFDVQVARLRAGPPRVAFKDAVLPLFRALKSHINDRHLVLVGADSGLEEEYKEYQAVVTGAAPSLSGCSAEGAALSTARLAPLLQPGGRPARLLTVSAHLRGDTLELACDQVRHTLTARPSAAPEPNQPALPAYQWRRAGDVAIIRLRRFKGSPAEQTLLEKLAADYPQHRRARLLIFDLRGNEGGNDGHAYRWVEQAKRGEWSARSWSVYPPGSYIPWHRWNNQVWDGIQHGRIDDPAAVAEREKLKADWPRRPADLFVRSQEIRVHNQARAPYQGKVVVLVDRGCGSAGEGAAMMLRQALGAALVGERTAGFQEYGNQRPLVLPRTQLMFFFATKRNYFTVPVESVGMPVDHYLPAALTGAPVEQLLPLLRGLPRVAP